MTRPAGRLPDVAPTLLLALAIALALYLLLLRLSYRVGTIVVFTLASIVAVEPSVFEVLFLAWAIHGYRTGRLRFASLRDRPLRWTLAGVIILALFTLVAWVVAGPRVISTVNAPTTGYCLALFLTIAATRSSETIAATRSSETIADDVVAGLILGGLVGTTAAWIGGLVPELRGVVWQYGVEFRGFFKDSNVFGTSLFLPAAVSLLRGLDPGAANGRRFAWLGVFLVLVSGVVMSGSRAAFGGLAVALPAVLILASSDLTRRTKVSGAVLATVVLAAGFALAAATGVEGHPLSLRSYDIQSRFPEIAAALREIPGRPLGLGPELALGRLGLNVHNLLVLVFLEEGWLGGLGLILALGALILVGWRAARGPLRSAALAALVGYLVVSMVVSTLHWRDFWIVAAVVATLAGKSVVRAGGPCYTSVGKSESKTDVWRRWGVFHERNKGTEMGREGYLQRSNHATERSPRRDDGPRG